MKHNHLEALENSSYKSLVPTSVLRVFKSTLHTLQLYAPFVLDERAYMHEEDDAYDAVGAYHKLSSTDKHVVREALHGVLQMIDSLTGLQRQHALLLLDEFYGLEDTKGKLEAAMVYAKYDVSALLRENEIKDVLVLQSLRGESYARQILSPTEVEEEPI